MNKAIEEINSEISKVHELVDIAYEYNQKDSTRTELSQKCTTYLLDVWQTMGAIADDFSLLFDGMTNGEVIQTLFPNGKVIKYDEAIGYEQMLDDKYSYCSFFDGLWWNALYKRGGR